MVAKLAAESREGPAERSERIIGLWEEQARHPLPGWRNLAANEVREQTPRLMATEGFLADAAPFDLRRSQEVDAQPHVAYSPVTRAVTRLTVTLSLDKFNRREATHANPGRDRPAARKGTSGMEYEDAEDIRVEEGGGRGIVSEDWCGRSIGGPVRLPYLNGDTP